MIERKRSNNSIYLVENGQSETRPNILRPLEKTNSLQKKSNGVTVYCSRLCQLNYYYFVVTIVTREKLIRYHFAIENFCRCSDKADFDKQGCHPQGCQVCHALHIQMPYLNLIHTRDMYQHYFLKCFALNTYFRIKFVKHLLDFNYIKINTAT